MVISTQQDLAFLLLKMHQVMVFPYSGMIHLLILMAVGKDFSLDAKSIPPYTPFPFVI